MKQLILTTAVMLAYAGASAQSPVTSVKFTNVKAPVTSTSTTGNPQNQFYHAQHTGAAWGDINNDGYPDLFYSDRNTHINNSTIHTNLYYNNGNGTFKRGGITPIKGTAFSAPAWIDFDNDGRLDLILTGLGSYGYRWNTADTDLTQIVAHLYQNNAGSNGNPSFKEVVNHGIRPLFNGNVGGKAHNWVSVGDYDNDGYADIAMTGFDETARFESDEPIEAYRAVYLYHNNGDGTFQLQQTPLNGDAPFHGLTDGSVVLEDIDCDGYLDLFATGYGAKRTSETYIYWNNGDGTFTEHAEHFHPVTNASSTIADLNSDGHPDIILAGHYLNNNSKNFYICKNLGERKFEMLPLDQFEGSDGTQISVGDVNNDGYPDILAGGHFRDHEHTTVIYINKGVFNFDTYGAHYDDPFGKKGHLSRVTHGAHKLVDVDRDGFLDAWFSGWNNGGCDKGCSTELWHNDSGTKGIAANEVPSAPSALAATIDDGAGTVTFTWAAATDDTTPVEALRYNLFVRNTATGKQTCTILADITTGYIKVSETNGAIRRCTYTMQLPSDGSYQWGVQAIDASNEGGVFATSTIDIAGVGSITDDEVLVIVEGGNGEIRITAPDGATASIYNTSGVMTDNVDIMQQTSVNAMPGVYIVNVATANGKSAHKVIVK